MVYDNYYYFSWSNNSIADDAHVNNFVLSIKRNVRLREPNETVKNSSTIPVYNGPFAGTDEEEEDAVVFESIILSVKTKAFEFGATVREGETVTIGKPNEGPFAFFFKDT